LIGGVLLRDRLDGLRLDQRLGGVVNAAGQVTVSVGDGLRREQPGEQPHRFPFSVPSVRFRIRHYSAWLELNVGAWLMRWPLLRVAVVERSMLPGLQPGDWLLARRTTRVRPGQVVLAWHPQRPGFLLVKRVAWREDGGWWLASDNPAAGAA